MATINIGGTKIPNLVYPVLVRTSEVYIDDSFLDDYVTTLALDASWTIGGDLQNKEAAIFRSQVYIEAQYYQGQKHWNEQILQWPRYPVYDKNDFMVDAEQTPYDIFNAVAEGAFHEYNTPGILQPQETSSDDYPLKRTRAKADVVETEKEFETTNRPKVHSADRLKRLQGYLRNWVVAYGVAIPLMRT